MTLINEAATCVLCHRAGMTMACGGSPIVFLLPVSDRLLISERNVSYLGLHASFAKHKNKTSCTVSGANGRHVPFFLLNKVDGCHKTLSKSQLVGPVGCSL